MFSLSKGSDIWTLHFDVDAVSRLLFIAAGCAGIGFGVFQVGRVHGSEFSLIVLSVLGCGALMAYWTLSDEPTTTVFDLTQRRITVDCKRPWFGPPRTFSFDDVAALDAVRRSGKASSSWEARLELQNGSSIKLGREPTGRNEHIRGLLDEIRRATDIGGA